MNNFEKNIVVFLNHFKWAPIDWASNMISDIKILVVLWASIIIFSMFIDFNFGFNILMRLILVFVIHYIISEGIIKYGAKKLSLQRVRPYVAYPKEIRGIGRNFSDSSFPSSHVSSVVGGLVILHWAYPSMWPALVIFAMLLAFSRIHNGMHYPSDILAGIFLGLFYGWVALILMV